MFLNRKFASLNSHPRIRSYFFQGKSNNNYVKFIGFTGGQLTPLNIRLGNFNRQTLQWIKVRNFDEQYFIF